MHLTYDPAQGEAFWDQIERLPGYPAGVRMPIRLMQFESGALFKLGEALSAAGADPRLPALVVMDRTPMRRGRESLKPLALGVLRESGWEAQTVEIEPDEAGQVHTDMPRIQFVQRRLQHGAAVIALGSGTVCDIAKHACYLYEQETGERLPFLVYQTANSVSAFTSNMAPTFIEGVKRTLDSRYPDALVCDLETLCDAPPEMTAAGVGDLLAAFVSFPDWLLAHKLGMDPTYTPLAQELMGPLDQIFLTEAEAVRRGELEGVAILAKLIALGGLAMSLSHATTPMSGYEHVISHILDLLAESAGRPLAAHGSQAALASVLGAAAYQRFLEEFDPARVQVERCYPAGDEMHALIRATFRQVDPSGKAGEECWADYSLKLEAWRAHRAELPAFLQDWQALKPALQALTRPPQQLIDILKAVDAPVYFDELVPPVAESEAKFAFLNAPLMRKRLTLGDVLIFFGWDRERLWEEIRGRVVRE